MVCVNIEKLKGFRKKKIVYSNKWSCKYYYIQLKFRLHAGASLA
jgi:hypothetical protein